MSNREFNIALIAFSLGSAFTQIAYVIGQVIAS